MHAFVSGTESLMQAFLQYYEMLSNWNAWVIAHIDKLNLIDLRPWLPLARRHAMQASQYQPLGLSHAHPHDWTSDAGALPVLPFLIPILSTDFPYLVF